MYPVPCLQPFLFPVFSTPSPCSQSEFFLMFIPIALLTLLLFNTFSEFGTRPTMIFYTSVLQITPVVIKNRFAAMPTEYDIQKTMALRAFSWSSNLFIPSMTTMRTQFFFFFFLYLHPHFLLTGISSIEYINMFLRNVRRDLKGQDSWYRCFHRCPTGLHLGGILLCHIVQQERINRGSCIFYRC